MSAAVAADGLVLLAMVATFALVMFALARPASLRRPWWPLAAAVGVWLAGVAVLAAAIVRGRAIMVAQTLVEGATDPSERATAIARGITLQLDYAQLLGEALMGAIWFAAVVMALVAVIGRRDRRPLAEPLLLVTAVTLPLIVAGASVYAWARLIAETFAGIAGAAPADKPTLAARGVVAAQARLGDWRLALVAAIVLAAASMIIAAVLAARRGRIAAPALRWGAVALFALGAIAFAATRGHAWDGAHPLPAIEATHLVSGKTIEHAPRVERCGESLDEAPIVDAGEGLVLNGQPVTPAELDGELRVLENRHKLLHPDDDDGWATHPSLILLAPADKPARELVAIFAAAKAAGYAKVQAAVIVPADVETRTLGRLSRASQCRRDLALDSAFAPAAGATWAQLLVHDAL